MPRLSPVRRVRKPARPPYTGGVYELLIESTFHATHAITIRGVPEEPHAHDWLVVVRVTGESLDADGVVCDFHELESHLDRILTPLKGADLNTVEPFIDAAPSAERVAEHIARSLDACYADGDRVRIADVTVTEAPGCRARFVLAR
jgi:6-pyruvoyltetrahydropterin/6-carboxytetrahydropterin synthase